MEGVVEMMEKATAQLDLNAPTLETFHLGSPRSNAATSQLLTDALNFQHVADALARLLNLA